MTYSPSELDICVHAGDHRLSALSGNSSSTSAPGGGCSSLVASSLGLAVGSPTASGAATHCAGSVDT